MKLSEAPDSTLIAAYVKLRDARAARKREFDAADEQDKSRQAKVESEMLRRLNDRGTDLVGARGVGTAYRKVVSSCSVADWNTYLNEFVIPNQAWDFLERRASKEAVQTFRDEQQDLPPGVNWTETVTVGFRRS